MAKTPRVRGLDTFGLTLPALTRLGSRKVRFSIQLTGKTAFQLWHHAPKQRDVLLRQALARQLVRLRRDFEAISPNGTEVYSRLRKARLRPEYRWSPTSKDRERRRPSARTQD
jgi:hypothetical protein